MPENWKDALVKFGPWTLLVFYLLGAIPGYPGPVQTFADALRVHDTHTIEFQKEQLKTLRGICYRLPAKADFRANCE